MCDASEGGCEGPQPRRAPRRGGCLLKCMKCKEGSPALIIRTADAFCKSCFKDYFVHKFRATLGKNRCVYPREKVLLAFSGGPSSSSMVRQVQDGLSQEAAKKLRFVPGIVYIDEGAVCGQNPEKRAEVCSQVEAVLQATGFPYYLVRLEEVFDLPSSVLHSVSHSAPDHHDGSYKEAVDGFIRQQQQCERMADTPNSVSGQLGELSIQDSFQKQGVTHHAAGPSRTKELTKLFDAVKTLTAKEDLLQTLRNHLLLHVARMRGYTKVMLGDSCTRVAVKLLTNLCLGRGAFLAVDTGFVDNRYGDVPFLRPMREYPAKEIAFYNRLFGVPTVFTPALDTRAPDRASIHRLIENFLCTLQSDFPSTVNTVYRKQLLRKVELSKTGEKLSPAPGHAGAGGSTAATKCLFCLCPVDTNLVDGSSLQSTVLSEQLSRKPPPPSSEIGCCGGARKEAGCCRGPSEPQASSHHGQISPLLCYSCRLTLKDMSCSDPLPTYIHLEAERRRCRAAMREEIQEFLLEEDSEVGGHFPLS